MTATLVAMMSTEIRRAGGYSSDRMECTAEPPRSACKDVTAYCSLFNHPCLEQRRIDQLTQYRRLVV